MLAAGRVRSKKKKKKIHTKYRRTQNTPRNPQQAGNCDHLDTYGVQRNTSHAIAYTRSLLQVDTRFMEFGTVQPSQ